MVDPSPAAPPAAAPPPPPPPSEAWPPLAPAVTPPPGLLGRIATVIAGMALLAYVVAAVVLAVPVETPGVQDCGSPGAYLLAGRLDKVPDESNRILGPDEEIITLDDDVAATARATPCKERVADRAVPVALLVLAATVVGAGAFAIELFVVRPRQRRLVREALGPPPFEPPLPAARPRDATVWGDPPDGSGG